MFEKYNTFLLYMGDYRKHKFALKYQNQELYKCYKFVNLPYHSLSIIISSNGKHNICYEHLCDFMWDL